MSWCMMKENVEGGNCFMDNTKFAEKLFFIKNTHQYPSGFDKKLAEELESKGVIYHCPAYKYEDNVKTEIDTLDVDTEKLKMLYGVDISIN